MILILVVVDNGLVQVLRLTTAYQAVSLNPCCSGQWSRTFSDFCCGISIVVLILVVMEDGLVLRIR